MSTTVRFPSSLVMRYKGAQGKGASVLNTSLLLPFAPLSLVPSSQHILKLKPTNQMEPSLPHQVYLKGDQIYTCSGCHAHLARNDDIISKGFQGRHGRAYLFKSVQNITLGPKEDRTLMTGLHSVADITCIVCQSVVGWIYIYAFEESQKYKEGKFIVEKAKISKENNWIYS